MELSGKKIFVTGGTSGLGLELVRRLLLQGAEVYATGRKLNENLPEKDNFRFIPVDFTDLKNLTETISEFLNEKILFDVVINNAGVLSPPEYQETKDGVEYSFQVNFLSHILINEMILRKKAYNDPLLIIAVTSPVYRFVRPDFTIPRKTDYRPFRIYSESKYYMLLIGDYLKNECLGSNFRFLGFNPGIFGSGIYRMQKPWFRAMYRFAAPFMRSSGKVAESLIDVIKKEDIVFNEIYSGTGHPVIFAHDKAASGKLFCECKEALYRARL